MLQHMEHMLQVRDTQAVAQIVLADIHTNYGCLHMVHVVPDNIQCHVACQLTVPVAALPLSLTAHTTQAGAQWLDGGPTEQQVDEDDKIMCPMTS